MKVFSEDEVIKNSTEYFNGDTLAASVVAKKYLLRNSKEEYLESSPDDIHQRLSKEFSRMEDLFGGDRKLTKEQIYDFLKNFDNVVPQGSPMMGIGNNEKVVSLSNCMVIESPEDDISSIFDAGKNLANLMKRRVGVGIDISKLRPDGAVVSNSAGTPTGAWSFADFYSYITRKIGQNNRRGALMITIDVRHPDIESFINMKSIPHPKLKELGVV